jgi:hypothetical protein
MTLRILRNRQRLRSAVYPIRRVKRQILNMVAELADVYQLALETPDEFPWQAAAISVHWTPIVRRILASQLQDIQELECLNNMIAFLDLDVEEFITFLPEQVEEVIDACANYTLFEPHWAEMEPVLIGHLRRFQVEEVQEEQMAFG